MKTVKRQNDELKRQKLDPQSQTTSVYHIFSNSILGKNETTYKKEKEKEEFCSLWCDSWFVVLVTFHIIPLRIIL